MPKEHHTLDDCNETIMIDVSIISISMCVWHIRTLDEFRTEQPLNQYQAIYFTSLLTSEKVWTKDELLKVGNVKS